MLRRTLGNTGIDVSALALGTGELGRDELTEDEVGTVLNAAVDLGITLVDTAPSYGQAEERIGRHLSWRRRDFVLSTKVGYGIPGVPDWTGACIGPGVERALSRMRTDWLDLVHLHSCDRATLERGDVIEALVREKAAGRVRAIAYSGDNEALDAAIDSGAFDVVQLSLNLFDQRGLAAAARAEARGIGVLVKRTLGNAVWRLSEPPHRPDLAVYWERWRALELPLEGNPIHEVALRFSAFAPGVTSCIIGTSRRERLCQNIDALGSGPLSPEHTRKLQNAFRSVGSGWPSLI